MATSPKPRSFPAKSSGSRDSGDSEEDDGETVTMLELFQGRAREKTAHQRLIVVTRLHCHLADRKELGAHYQKLHVQLSRQYLQDQMTGLLLIYQCFLLHIVESSRDILLAVLKDLGDLQQRQDSGLLDKSKVMFLGHNPKRRLFKQWSYKMMDSGPDSGFSMVEEEEDEESAESLVMTVLSALQKLEERIEKSTEAVTGSEEDEGPELTVPQAVLHKLLARDELLTPQQHLQMYGSLSDISMDFGQHTHSRCLSTV